MVTHTPRLLTGSKSSSAGRKLVVKISKSRSTPTIRSTHHCFIHNGENCRSLLCITPQGMAAVRLGDFLLSVCPTEAEGKISSVFFRFLAACFTECSQTKLLHLTVKSQSLTAIMEITLQTLYCQEVLPPPVRVRSFGERRVCLFVHKVVLRATVDHRMKSIQPKP